MSYFPRLPCKGEHLECRAEELQIDELKQLRDRGYAVGPPTADEGSTVDTTPTSVVESAPKTPKNAAVQQLSQVFIRERTEDSMDTDDVVEVPLPTSGSQLATGPSKTTRPAPPIANAGNTATNKVYPLFAPKPNAKQQRVDKTTASIPPPALAAPVITISHYEWSDFTADSSQCSVLSSVHRPNAPSKWSKYVSSDAQRCDDAATTESQTDVYAAKRPRHEPDDEAIATQPSTTQSPFVSAHSEFKTAREQLLLSERQRNERAPIQNAPTASTTDAIAPLRKSLGSRRSAVTSRFVSPLMQTHAPTPARITVEQPTPTAAAAATADDDDVHPRLKHIDPKMVELIRSEIMHSGVGDDQRPIGWDDIAGLQYAKQTIREAVVWPMLRPDIFTGLRRPPRGILLFGPPGTGKTLIGKCIAAQSKSTFFSISAASLTSKWIGDGEKMVRALFAVAAVHQPAVVFIDEIDSLLSQRSDTEHESSRRLKTEFLVQLDGATTADDERILIVGATNRPQELDEAARRRLVKRLYVPLPDEEARQQLLVNLLRLERNELSAADVASVAQATGGFSGADMKVLCQEASMGPIRAIGSDRMEAIDIGAVRAVAHADFAEALRRVRPSVSPGDLAQYVRWDVTYGSGACGQQGA